MGNSWSVLHASKCPLRAKIQRVPIKVHPSTTEPIPSHPVLSHSRMVALLDQVLNTEAWAFIIPLEILHGLGFCGPRVNYAYLRASNARALFVKVPEKIWGKNTHLARARVMGKWRADLWEQFFVGNDARASFVKVPEKFGEKTRIRCASKFSEFSNNFKKFQHFSKIFKNFQNF